MKLSAITGCAEAQFYLASQNLLNGSLKEGESYLLRAVRKQEFYDKAKEWLNVESTPANVKAVLQSVIQKSGM